jgi:hypothetical protein
LFSHHSLSNHSLVHPYNYHFFILNLPDHLFKPYKVGWHCPRSLLLAISRHFLFLALIFVFKDLNFLLRIKLNTVISTITILFEIAEPNEFVFGDGSEERDATAPAGGEREATIRMEMGVAREDIILGLQPPDKRPYTEYGVA